jgi:leucyl aminopeptidase
MKWSHVIVSALPKTDCWVVFKQSLPSIIPDQLVGIISDELSFHAKTKKASPTHDHVLVDVHTHGIVDARHILVVDGIPGVLDVSERLELFADIARHLRTHRISSVAYFIPDDTESQASSFGYAAIVGTELASYRFETHKTVDIEPQQLTSCIIVSTHMHGDVITSAEIEAKAVLYSRHLVNQPSSHLTPTHLAESALALADDSNGTIQTIVYGPKEMADMGMGALLGIAKGSDEEPRFIELSYTPKKKAKKTICLVGKGITFDTGGISLKPTGHIETMKMDMAGAAAVLGVFSTLTKIHPDVNIIGVIASTENMPSGKAIKPGDVVTAMNGKTIEILNTDAEGRVVLADAMSYVGKKLHPDVIIDLATLTGACMVALGETYAGVFANDERLYESFMCATSETGEKFWRLPLVEEYKKELKSDVADVKNTGSTRYGGAINGALFIGEFVPEGVPWMHLDIAGPAFAEHAAPLTPIGGTGFGVTTLIRYIKDQAKEH